MSYFCDQSDCSDLADRVRDKNLLHFHFTDLPYRIQQDDYRPYHFVEENRFMRHTQPEENWPERRVPHRRAVTRWKPGKSLDIVLNDLLIDSVYVLVPSDAAKEKLYEKYIRHPYFSKVRVWVSDDLKGFLKFGGANVRDELYVLP